MIPQFPVYDCRLEVEREREKEYLARPPLITGCEREEERERVSESIERSGGLSLIRDPRVAGGGFFFPIQ